MAVIELTRHNFDAEAAKESKAVLIDFSAAWCGPCRMLSPSSMRLPRKRGGAVKVCKVDIDKRARTGRTLRCDEHPHARRPEGRQNGRLFRGTQAQARHLQMIEEAE